MTASCLPNTSAPSWRSELTVPAPATARSISGSIGDQPSVAVTIVDAFTVVSSWPRPCCSRPWATMVTAVTSATPIISALAVTAVRPGLRMALSRASRPAAPPSLAAGRPSSEAMARTPRANSRTLTAPSASRSAATGAIFVARRAGIIAASTVASVPTSSETTTVRAGERDALGRQLHARSR